MTIIRIDDREYDTDTFTPEAKTQLASLQFVEGELSRLNAKAAVYQTARIAYANALKAALPTVKLEGESPTG